MLKDLLLQVMCFSISVTVTSSILEDYYLILLFRVCCFTLSVASDFLTHMF